MNSDLISTFAYPFLSFINKGMSGLPGVSSLWPVLLLGLLRVWAALTNCLPDCDEVYNYYEPLHYLLYQSGYQTWEYSPIYALRTYTYLMPWYIIGQIGKYLVLPFITIFYEGLENLHLAINSTTDPVVNDNANSSDAFRILQGSLNSVVSYIYRVLTNYFMKVDKLLLQSRNCMKMCLGV